MIGKGGGRMKRLRILSVIAVVVSLIFIAVIAIDLIVFKNQFSIATLLPLVFLVLSVVFWRMTKKER